MSTAVTTTPLTTGTWDVDPSHSTIGFTVRHLGFSKVRGGFSDYSGQVVVGEDLASSKAEITLQAASFHSGDEGRDEHVRSGDFLDADNFPTLTFVTTGVAHTGGNEYVITGDLTIHGVTKQVDLDTEFLGEDTDPFGNVKAGFEATTEIERDDFGLTWNAALESGGVLVGKKVAINLEVQLTKD